MADDGDKEENPARQRQNAPGMLVVDGVIVYDGESEELGLPSRVGQPAPPQAPDKSPPLDADDDEEDGAA